MKTFSDLEFKPHPMGSGIISRIKFDTNDQLTYETTVTSDVEGYLTEEDVTKLLIQIQNL